MPYSALDAEMCLFSALDAEMCLFSALDAEMCLFSAFDAEPRAKVRSTTLDSASSAENENEKTTGVER